MFERIVEIATKLAAFAVLHGYKFEWAIAKGKNPAFLPTIGNVPDHLLAPAEKELNALGRAYGEKFWEGIKSAGVMTEADSTYFAGQICLALEKARKQTPAPADVAALVAKNEETEKENADLRAKLAEMEKFAAELAAK